MLLHRIPDLRSLVRHAKGEDPDTGSEAASLRVLTVPILLLTAFDSARDGLQQEREIDAEGARDTRLRTPLALTWGPALLAPVAAAAHIAHARRPSHSTAAATRLLNASAIGLGLSTLGAFFHTRKANSVPSLAPLAFATAGLLGILLDRHEREQEAETRQLRRRARLVERLVPRRRAKLEGIVLHI